MLRLPGQEADVRRTDKTKMNAPRQTRQTLRMEELRDQEARAAAAPKAKTLTTNSKMDGGAHASSGASRELLQSIAARLDAKLQKHAKGSWAKLFFAVDHDGSERVEFHDGFVTAPEFKLFIQNVLANHPDAPPPKPEPAKPEPEAAVEEADEAAAPKPAVHAPPYFGPEAEEPPAAEETEEEWLSQEALWSIAHRLEKKLQRYAKGSWMKLFFVIDKDGSEGFAARVRGARRGARATFEGERAAFAAKQLADEAAKQAAIAAKDGELDAAGGGGEVGRLETEERFAEAAAAAAADAADAKADRDRLLGKFDALEAELDDARVRSDAGLRRAASSRRARAGRARRHGPQDGAGAPRALRIDAARWSLSSPTNRFEQRSRERPVTPRFSLTAATAATARSSSSTSRAARALALARDAASATAAAALNIVRHWREAAETRGPADDKPSFFSGAHGAVLLKPGFGLPKLDAARATLVERAAAAQREPPRPAPPAAEPPAEAAAAKLQAQEGRRGRRRGPRN
ncbi:hypothetical protein JL721_12722 [Aureococcus anophagefferens]|nr:hypothetical protein JL721_12722 [Aureococcus anophagefferens]